MNAARPAAGRTPSPGCWRIARWGLAPVLLWQGLRVRRTALRLPEAAGPREGAVGDGATVLRLLVVGDSSAAGVGAATQQEALASRLAKALAARLHGRVAWQLVARTGLTAAQAAERLAGTPLHRADVLVTAVGVNDAVAHTSPRRFVAALEALHTDAVQRAGVRWSLHSAVPPMHVFPLLPQPLRAALGAQALRLNHALAQDLRGQPARCMVALPAALHREAATLMASDGFHPGPSGYLVWAATLAEQIVAIHLATRPLDASRRLTPAPPDACAWRQTAR